ncbi:unnamed protein product [Protopolystoma xenopodis]|uniref:Uncharacterized protein n=1 Tax=Protopolystoma xenopodis TaxID=117903 RepID=A0A3S5BPR2_9PLAT|nr:unnamed protein product [Protopolystoma xenopodis]
MLNRSTPNNDLATSDYSVVMIEFFKVQSLPAWLRRARQEPCTFGLFRGSPCFHAPASAAPAP